MRRSSSLLAQQRELLCSSCSGGPAWPGQQFPPLDQPCNHDSCDALELLKKRICSFKTKDSLKTPKLAKKMIAAPPGFHWECVGYACIPLDPALPICSAALKASDGKHSRCAQRACCDLAERNTRLFMTGIIGRERMAELSEDLRSYCSTAHVYQQLLLQNPCWPLESRRDIRLKLKERRKALKQWLTLFSRN